MHPAVQIDKSILQSGFILCPRHAIDTRRSLTLKRVKAVAEYLDAQMVEQSREPLLLSFPCYLPHTVQSLGHALPALCRVHVRLSDFAHEFGISRIGTVWVVSRSTISTNHPEGGADRDFLLALPGKNSGLCNRRTAGDQTPCSIASPKRVSERFSQSTVQNNPRIGIAMRA